MTRLFRPLFRALTQLRDRAFLAVLSYSLGLSLLSFLVLHALAVWIVHGLLEWQGPLAWLADLLGSLAASMLALWLFLPVAAVIASLFMERIAGAVEARYYPHLPPAQGASLTAQIWDGLALGLRILLLNLLALLLALLLVLLLPGPGLLLGWLIAAYGLGRGLFVAVAMRRMNRREAEQTWRQGRLTILAQGGLMALAGTIPLLNLLIPVLGTAAMVHVLDDTIDRLHPDNRIFPVVPAKRRV